MQRTIKPNKSEEPKDAKVKVDLTISGEALKQALKPKEDNHIDLGPKKIRYQKLGGGSLRMLNRIIKPNQIFSAYPEEIPEAFNRWIKPLDPLPEKKRKGKRCCNCCIFSQTIWG